MTLLSNTLNLNDLKIFTIDKNETIALGKIVSFKGEVGKEEWVSSIDLNLRTKEVKDCFSGGDPLSVLKGLKFIRLRTVAINQSEIVEIIEDTGFVELLIKQNSFKKVTKKLFKLGITPQLIDIIPIGYAYYGMREICFCNIDYCYHSNILILKYEDYFVIPFIFSFAAPDYYFDFSIRYMRPIKEYNLNECDEDEWENIFD